MSMVGVGVLCVLSAVLGWIVGYILGEKSEESFWKRLIVDRGVARWVPSPDGKACKFEWITTPTWIPCETEGEDQ